MELCITSNMPGKKVAVIGAGYVGASIAYSLTITGLAREIVLIECPEAVEKCKAEVNDIRHGIPNICSPIVHCGDYSDIRDCDLIIVAAGRNRHPGETRLEMTADNFRVATQIAKSIKEYYTKGVIVVVTNPVDIITEVLANSLALPDGMVFGTGCLLDSSRLTSVISDYIGVCNEGINAHVIGEHGDGQIILWSKATIAGVQIDEFCQMNGLVFTEDTKIMIEKKVRLMGEEIIRGKGRTHYGIATCVCYIADVVLNCRSTIISVSSMLNGEYGLNGIALSLPSIVTSNGVKCRLIDSLSSAELSKLHAVAKKLSSVLNGLY